VPPFAHLYQLNIEVPSAAGNGDQRIVVETNGASSLNNAACCFVTVQR
jgi:uncharacterized protein (TIGR03437 family)